MVANSVNILDKSPMFNPGFNSILPINDLIYRLKINRSSNNTSEDFNMIDWYHHSVFSSITGSCL
ncbi:hypothetical protein BscR1v2_007870 [Bartonella schoenbuchensis R1]|uniref:Uncharacterized protein n=2 Tax=Bartonella schoenbuchensis TaxID=165694 RepID=A0A1S6XQU2_BARSR|nr:hypothetical protein BscR1v2_007870 [Bartonella schoenbuchensis R1]CDP80144.1 hypothetical protein BN1046_01060 [Bartonella schoenbuchensis]